MSDQTITSFLLINCTLGAEEKLLEELKKIDEVKECHAVMGAYDIIARLEVENAKLLRPLVTSKIRVLADVRETMTVIAV